MKNAESSVTLDKTDNEALTAYLKNKQPGDDYSILIRGKVVDNTEETFVGDVSSVVEQSDTDVSDDEETETEADDEEAEGETSPDTAKGLAAAFGTKKAK